jgi:hypothetical protein
LGAGFAPGLKPGGKIAQKNRSGRLRGNYFFLLKMRECLDFKPRAHHPKSAQRRRLPTTRGKILASHIDVSPCAPRLSALGPMLRRA